MTLLDHLATGETTVCRCWAVTRKDGVSLGFTDHDRDLSFEGITFRAGSGLTAKAVEKSSGLSIDNTEAVGVLSDAAISEADIDAGRFDGADVRFWWVNWSDVSQRMLRFRGFIGEMRRAGIEFTAELRGLAEALNRPQGRVYQRDCPAVLGDGTCGFDTATEGFRAEAAPVSVVDNRVFLFSGLQDFEPRWFEKGRLTVLSGQAAGLVGLVKTNRFTDAGLHEVTLWEPLGADVVAGDTLRIEAGCDKRMATCRAKFGNIANFRGFPDIPGEDWLVSSPLTASDNDGGSLR